MKIGHGFTSLRRIGTAQHRRNQTVLLRVFFASFAPWRSNCCPALTAKTQRARRIREKNSIQAAKDFRLGSTESILKDRGTAAKPVCIRIAVCSHWPLLLIIHFWFFAISVVARQGGGGVSLQRGISLAQQNRLEEAEREFDAVPLSDPSYWQAQYYSAVAK